MRLLAFLDTAAAEAFAIEIATDFAHNFPLNAAGDTGAEQKLAHAIEVLGNRAARFNREHPLGWYRKAKFMSAVKGSLAGRGYPDELVDRIIYAVVLRMARRGG